jgi:hypothetical protein
MPLLYGTGMNDDENLAWVGAEPPKATGRSRPLPLQNMTGMLFAWNRQREQPVFLSIPGSPHLYLALFHSPHLLDEAMEKAGTKYDSIKRVEDGPEFYQSLKENPPTSEGGQLKVIQDLRFLPDGRVRYIEAKED